MGKFRSKLKGQTKGKRWPKGQSSNSNPETRKHREAAKSPFFNKSLGVSNLTTDALRKHDVDSVRLSTSAPSVAFTNTDDGNSTFNCTFKTFDTFASDWSECSNTSFSKLMQTFRSDSALHKNMLAVLAAVTEVIKSQNGTESSTEYYAALMTSLEATEDEESIMAILSLLSLVIKSVPRPVLCSQFSIASNVFLKHLENYAQTDNNVICRSLLTCLLRSQEIAVWTDSSTLKVFDALMAFAAHSKPRVRKSAQHAICAVLRGSHFMLESKEDGNEMQVDLPSHHPGAARAADHCTRLIESSMGTVGGQTTILHILTLLKDIIQTFPKAQIKKVCEVILKIMMLNNALVSSCSMQVMHALFSAQHVTVPATLNAQIIAALYDYQPSSTDTQPTLAWIAVMQQAHIHLADADIKICMMNLSRIINEFTQLWLTDRKEVIISITHALQALVEDCIGPACDGPEATRQHSAPLKMCFEQLEQCLGYQYFASWIQVLHVMNTIFKVAGPNCSNMLISYLKTLSELRNSYKFSYNIELEFTIGAAVRYMGPEIVLSIIPFTKSDGEVNIDHSWMLQILHDNVQRSTLQYFGQEILPLASKCKTRAEELQKQNNFAQAHSLELFCAQLWALFPSFCNGPTDIASSFKIIARILGNVVQNFKDYRLSVMSGLRKLITHAKENDQKEDIDILANYAKNFLPILFNLYVAKPDGSDEEGQRLAALETVKVYLTIAPEDKREKFFNEALSIISENKTDVNTENFFDIIRLLCIYQKKEKLDELYKQCVVKLAENKNHKLQKKAYRIMEDICASDNPECVKFVASNRKEMQKVLLKTLKKTAPSSKGARIKCLNLILRSQEHTDVKSKFLIDAFTEAVASMRDINERCREAAETMIITIGNSLQKMNQLDYYIKLVVSGLTSPVIEMKSNTILALTPVLCHFKDSLNSDILKLILTRICELIPHEKREIVGPCIEFIKVYQSIMPLMLTASSLPIIVNSLSNMTEDSKGHFRMQIKNLLERLVRKYGVETISAHVCASDTITQKRLRNLRKLIARKKRQSESAKKTEAEDSDEENFTIKAKSRTVEDILASSDSEIDDDEKDTDKVKSVKNKSNAWIQENEDDITDFIDPSAVKKIRATNPVQVLKKTVEKKSTDHGFKTAPDGKLIITDGNSEDDDSDDKISFNSDNNSDDDAKGDMLVTSAKKRKRKSSDSMSVASGSGSVRGPASKYMAGGSGIHRPIKAPGSEYKSSKSKGDVKKAGKLEPFAYLPLQRSSLNKRKKIKNAGQFKSVVWGARKGAMKGRKAFKNKQ